MSLPHHRRIHQEPDPIHHAARLLFWVAIAVGAALVGIFLSGCAALGRGEQPTDTQIAGLHWYVDMPGYRAGDIGLVQWNFIGRDDGYHAWERLRNLCGEKTRYETEACTIRIRERGQCVVFSLYTWNEAGRRPIAGGDSLLLHELRHCGYGMPTPGGWSHRE